MRPTLSFSGAAAAMSASPSPTAFRSINPSAFLRRRQQPARRLPRTCLRAAASAGDRSDQWTRQLPAWAAEVDLYELLGVAPSSAQAEIKVAYRMLQKRCHPDVAGEAGHDMAVVLNEVYALLSDPAARLAYDKEQAKLSEFRGYTGKPLYSTWFGAESENRAVFVDEGQCVGCLKCALVARKTFAIETVYGRARAVGQWADTEDEIFAAIGTCPVNCISVVDRQDLPALEFLMSKLPRGAVRMSVGNTVGVRAPNVFADLDRFQRRYHNTQEAAARRGSKESSSIKESRNSAVQGIRSFSNFWYWQVPTAAMATSIQRSTVSAARRHPNTRLLEAAARSRAEDFGRHRETNANQEDYWAPTLTLPSAVGAALSPMMSNAESGASSRSRREATTRPPPAPRGILKILDLRVPLLIAVASSVIVGFRGQEIARNRLEEHVGGAAALEVVNSFQLQVILAGATWFVIGLAALSLVGALADRNDSSRR